jgi:tetratricopeptide (TPR) repeat protein
MLTAVLALLAFQSPPDSVSPVAIADREFALQNYFRSRVIYASMLSTSKDSAVVLWKLARACICEGDISSPEMKIKLYYQAKGFADRSVRADSLSSDGHVWRAISTGDIAMYEGGETKVQLCRVVKREIDRALALNVNNPLAYSILGSFYKALGDVSWIEKQLAYVFLGGLPDGGYDESVAAFKKSIALAPDVIRNHYELGKVYMSQDEDAMAKREFQRTLLLPIVVGMDREMQRSAIALLKELRQKHPDQARAEK